MSDDRLGDLRDDDEDDVEEEGRVAWLQFVFESLPPTRPIVDTRPL